MESVTKHKCSKNVKANCAWCSCVCSDKLRCAVIGYKLTRITLSFTVLLCALSYVLVDSYIAKNTWNKHNLAAVSIIIFLRQKDTLCL